MDAASALARFDAYPLFTTLGDALITGPTHNNLRDLRILLSGRSPQDAEKPVVG
jgi:hydroxypyruvate reductase